jgi:hypothetical protein
MVIAGLDLGQAADYSALVMVERSDRETEGRKESTYDVVDLHRWDLGTRYPAIAADVKRRLAQLREAGFESTLVVDKTGVGAPVVDMLKGQVSEWLVPVTITGGMEVHEEDGEYRVPKRDLVSAANVLLQSGRLRIARQLPLAAVLTEELMNFRVSISAAGRERYGAGEDLLWREGAHDDLVLALAMALWQAEQPPIGPVGYVITGKVKGGWFNV